ncbi:MAG: hypothetical protein M1338_00625 [Patescibacteria group bacterium]|nr:hypothetical protein [Patescibacteria group bacterium]
MSVERENTEKILRQGGWVLKAIMNNWKDHPINFAEAENAMEIAWSLFGKEEWKNAIDQSFEATKIANKLVIIYTKIFVGNSKLILNSSVEEFQKSVNNIYVLFQTEQNASIISIYGKECLKIVFEIKKLLAAKQLSSEITFGEIDNMIEDLRCTLSKIHDRKRPYARALLCAVEDYHKQEPNDLVKLAQLILDIKNFLRQTEYFFDIL